MFLGKKNPRMSFCAGFVAKILLSDGVAGTFSCKYGTVKS